MEMTRRTSLNPKYFYNELSSTTLHNHYYAHLTHFTRPYVTRRVHLGGSDVRGLWEVPSEERRHPLRRMRSLLHDPARLAG